MSEAVFPLMKISSSEHGSVAHQAFGTYLSGMIHDAGFHSDEQLTRRAMQLQTPDGPQLSIQRRTISNWRNGKSAPRSPHDPRLRLVLEALKASEEQQQHIADLISARASASERAGSAGKPAETAVGAGSRRWGLTGLAAVFVCVIVSIGIFSLSSDGHATYIETIPEDQLRLSDEGFVLPFSSDRSVSQQDLDALTGWELYVARNEIYARKGRPFVKAASLCLQNHFDTWAKDDHSGQGWYEKRAGGLSLSDLEVRNADMISKYECSVRGGRMDCSGNLRNCQ